MSIIINGMKMPECGRSVYLRIDDRGEVYIYGSYPTELYKAVELPPHGRLIDADKQDAQIEALIERHLHGYTKSTWDFVCELRDILKRNPTIIEAEGEE